MVFFVDEKIDKFKSYPDLKVEEVTSIITYGHDTKDLLSTQFVNKVLTLIRSGEYTLLDDIEQESLAS